MPNLNQKLRIADSIQKLVDEMLRVIAETPEASVKIPGTPREMIRSHIGYSLQLLTEEEV